jgi:hypothetical protein
MLAARMRKTKEKTVRLTSKRQCSTSTSQNMQILKAMEGLIPTLEGYGVHSWMSIANLPLPCSLFMATAIATCRSQQTTDLVAFYPIFFDFVLSASRLARALRISGFPSAQALSIVILLKRHLSRSRIRLQS